MPDYDRLQDFLLSRPAIVKSLVLTFGELENIVEGRLPDSARLYAAWWANDRGHSHTHALRWLRAGWKVASVDMDRLSVVFERLGAEAHLSELEAPNRVTDMPADGVPDRATRVAPAGGHGRRVGGYEFRRISEVEVSKSPDGSILTYRPQARYASRGRASLHKYGDGEFCKILVANAPEAEGVYALFVGDRLAYVGEAVNLAKRWYDYGQISPRKCYEGGQETNCRLNKLVLKTTRDGLSMTLWFHQTPSRKEIEADIRGRLNPPWNAI